MYNGWKNWETWNVTNWMSNHESLDAERSEMIREAMREDSREDAIANLAQALQDFWEAELESCSLPDHLADFIDFAPVDWREIATSWVGDEEAPEQWSDQPEAAEA